MSKEDNKAAWKILRETLSNFYAKKNEFYKEKKQENKQIIQSKVVLCEKAEELVNSQVSWKEKTDKLNKLNEDWKKSGYLPKSQSDKEIKLTIYKKMLINTKLTSLSLVHLKALTNSNLR